MCVRASLLVLLGLRKAVLLPDAEEAEVRARHADRVEGLDVLHLLGDGHRRLVDERRRHRHERARELRGLLELGRVRNRGIAPLNGGAVVGEVHLGTRASDTNFLARAGSTPATRRIEITTTAISPEGGTTQVRALIDYRDGAYALIDRRVLCLTPEATGC